MWSGATHTLKRSSELNIEQQSAMLVLLPDCKQHIQNLYLPLHSTSFQSTGPNVEAFKTLCVKTTKMPSSGQNRLHHRCCVWTSVNKIPLCPTSNSQFIKSAISNNDNMMDAAGNSMWSFDLNRGSEAVLWGEINNWVSSNKLLCDWGFLGAGKDSLIPYCQVVFETYIYGVYVHCS